MATTMMQDALDFVPEGTPHSQLVAVLAAPRRLETRRARIPEPGPGEIRIKVKWVGICGSDLEAYRGTRKPEFISFPARLGHEVAGIVDKVGAEVNGIAPGDIVACRYVWGAFAEYCVCKPFNVAVLPRDFPLVEASLIEVLPGIIHTAEIARLDAGRTVLVMGQGVSGLVLTQVLRLFSPKALVVTDIHQNKLVLAKKYGATHTYKLSRPDQPTMEAVGADFPSGFDVVVPCLLEGDGMVDAVEAAAFGGKIVMYGCIGVCNKPLDFFKVHRKRLDIHSTEPKRDIDMRRFFDESIRLVLGGLVDTSGIITAKLPLSEIQHAFELRDDPFNEHIHVLVDCEV